MVKGYDPTINDPSKIVLEYLLRWSTTQNPLSIDQAQKYTKYWLRNSQSTSSIYKKFSTLDSLNIKKPQIILRKKCSNLVNWSYWKILFKKKSQIDQNYPAFTQDNKIIVCLNLITNKTELKQNIDRQLTILMKKSQKESNQNKASQLLISQDIKNIANKSLDNKIQERDKQFIQFLYDGCRQGYKNYMLQKQVEQRLSKKCAKYLFFRRCQRQLPWDAKFRYASKIIQQVI